MRQKQNFPRDGLIQKGAAANAVSRRDGKPRRSAFSPPSLYAPNGRRKYLNLEELHRVLRCINRLPADRALLALVLIWTGCRVSEALALTPLSFQAHGVVAIRTLKRRNANIFREVPLPTELVRRVDAHFSIWRRQRDPLFADERLWPLCRQTVWRLSKRLGKEAGLEGPAAAPRGYRHSFGVNAVTAVPLTSVQRWLGHASLSSTAIYTHAVGPEERQLAARMWALIDGDMPAGGIGQH